MSDNHATKQSLTHLIQIAELALEQGTLSQAEVDELARRILASALAEIDAGGLSVETFAVPTVLKKLRDLLQQQK